jgi:hypothetical protein
LGDLAEEVDDASGALVLIVSDEESISNCDGWFSSLDPIEASEYQLATRAISHLCIQTERGRKDGTNKINRAHRLFRCLRFMAHTCDCTANEISWRESSVFTVNFSLTPAVALVLIIESLRGI